MNTSVYRWFGKVEDNSDEESILRVEQQKIVRVMNKWTLEQTCFNMMRADRPIEKDPRLDIPDIVPKELEEIPELCDFCSPISYTCSDTWGRIERDTCITSSNIAKYDGFHGIVVFKDHSPLKYSKVILDDLLTTCEEWFECAYKENTNVRYPLLIWDCKGDAGVSKHHNVAQILLAESFPYGSAASLQTVSQNYAQEFPGRSYFQDLIEVQSDIGLTKKIGAATILVNLTPYMAYELMVISWNYDANFFDALDMAIEILRTRFKSNTYNITLNYPPLIDGGQFRSRIPTDRLDMSIVGPDAVMPFVVCVGDRGELGTNPRNMADFCRMRMSGTSVIAVDPFYIGKVMNMDAVLWK